MTQFPIKTVALIVAHPDDETLWAGGTILSNPSWECFIISLCRASDVKRAPKFFKALSILNAGGIIGDLDDGPEQMPLDAAIVEQAILNLLPPKRFDLIISHSPAGEYTKHLRHEETGKAVIQLWYDGKIVAGELWNFAYEDGNKEYYPKPIEQGTIYHALSKPVWSKKYGIITKTYGFKKDTWEAKTTPEAEAFRQFSNSADAMKWLKNREIST